MSYDYELLVIGSGPAGQKAAIQAAKLGRHVAVVECREIGAVSARRFSTRTGCCCSTGSPRRWSSWGQA